MPNPVHVDIPEGIDEFAWFEGKDENDDSAKDEELVKFEVFHLLEKKHPPQCSKRYDHRVSIATEKPPNQTGC